MNKNIDFSKLSNSEINLKKKSYDDEYNFKKSKIIEMVYELEDTSKVETIFGGWEETLIYSCLQKVMGKIYVTDTEEPKSALFLFLFLELIIVIGLAIKLDSNLEKRYSERFSEDLEGEFEFYQDYFVLKTENITSKTQYTRIDRCIETDTNFYLECKRKNTTCVIQKEVCDPALMSFLRAKMNVVEKHVHGIKRADKSDGAKRTGKKKYYDPTVVNTMMHLLFILTIACLWLAQIVTYKISMAVIHTYDMVRFSWIDWCFLPIPITSVVLGYKYQDAGFKCKKNIIAGYIIGFILAIFGCYWLIFP